MLCQGWCGSTTPAGQGLDRQTEPEDNLSLPVVSGRHGEPYPPSLGHWKSAMPAVYTFEDTAYVEIIGTLNTKPYENTLYVKNGTFWTDVTLTSLVATVGAWWNVEIKPLVTPSLIITTIRAKNMGLPDSWVVEGTYTMAGTHSGSPVLPGNVSLVVKFGTGMAGRAKRGRNYLAGFAEDQVVQNAWDASLVSSVIAAYENLNVELQAVSPFWQHVIASRAGLPPEGGEGNTYVVSSYSANQAVKTQRGRLE